MKSLLISYEVKGEKIRYLLEWLHEKKVKVYDVKPIENGIILTIESKDCKKLFAISSNMCYNMKKLKYKGRFAFLKLLFENIGLAIGGALFVIAVFLFDGVITGTDYKGDYAYFRNEIDGALNSYKFLGRTFYYGNDNEEVAKKILSSSEDIAFASVKRKGHKIVIEVYKAKDEPVPINVKKSEIKSPVKGVVRQLVVLSGTALIKVGDEVEEGQTLIDGSYTHNEKTGVTYALGEAEIITEKTYEYKGIGEDEAVKSRAVLLAKQEISGEIVSYSAEITETESGKICLVRIKYSVWTN